MKRTTKMAAVILAAALLGTTGAYAYFSDTLTVNNRIVAGDINIGLAEYVKKGGTEVAYSNPETVLPGAMISKIPRITNYAMPCWVRVRITFENDREGQKGLDETMLSGFSGDWIKRGEYYYCREILNRNESVDLFQAVAVPSDWTEEHEDQKLGIVIRAEAIQAANFTPDFTAMSPWGNQEIQKCVHEEDGTAVCPPAETGLSVEFSGKAHKLLAVPGDFFAGMGAAMPGDVYEDTVTVSNTTDNEAEIFFRTAVGSAGKEQMEMLKETGLTIYLDGQPVYRGSLDSPELETNHSLGIYEPGKKGDLKFVLDIPETWDNAYALREAEVQWIFSVNEAKGDMSDADSGEAGGDALQKETGVNSPSPVKTGDTSNIHIAAIVSACSGTAALAGLIYRKRRRGS